MRIFIHAPRCVGNADEPEQLDRARARSLLGDVAVRLNRLDQLRAHLVEGVQRRERVLEDHRDLVAADRSHVAFGERYEIFTFEEDPPGHARALRARQAERGQRRDRLA